MYGTGTKKMLNILILDILKNYSDMKHKLTQPNIIKYLKNDYSMSCDRRSVKNNIEVLREIGYDIPIDNGYYINSDFENSELRMLIDSILFSKIISPSQAKRLIEKLKKLGNKYFEPKVNHISNLSELQHTKNPQVMNTIDKINDAIENKKKIKFIYNDYGTDFEMYPKLKSPYIVNPYQMVANNSYYYLVGNYDKYDDISHYRLDRMTDVEILDKENIKNLKDLVQNFNLPKHMAEHIYMFSGESVNIKILAQKNLMNDLIDWYGTDFKILEKNDNDMIVSLKCNEKAFECWALQYGKYIEVLEPIDLRKKIVDDIASMYEKYKEDRHK